MLEEVDISTGCQQRRRERGRSAVGVRKGTAEEEIKCLRGSKGGGWNISEREWCHHQWGSFCGGIDEIGIS